MWHADISTSRNNSILANISPISAQKLGEIGVSWHVKEMQGRDGVKYGMLMFPYHLQKWFDFGQYWPKFGPLVAKMFVNLGFQGILLKCIDIMPRNKVCKCIMTAFRTNRMTLYSKQILF